MNQMKEYVKNTFIFLDTQEYDLEVNCLYNLFEQEEDNNQNIPRYNWCWSFFIYNHHRLKL